MRYRITLLFLLALPMLSVPPAQADAVWQLTVTVVDQEQAPVPGACAWVEQTVAGPTEEPAIIKACDDENGEIDGTITVSGIPVDITVSLSIYDVPATCVQPPSIRELDPAVSTLTITMHCWTTDRMGTDVAALVLRPDDLPGSGWTHDGAFTDDLLAVGMNATAYRSNTAPGEVAQTLAAYGWNRFYTSSSSRSLASNPAAPVERVRSYVTEYVDDVGATDGFVYLEDETFIPSATDVTASRQFGEQSELTQDSGISPIEGVPYQSLDLTFRMGNIVAGVTLIVYDRGGAAKPEQATVESLAAILEERLISHDRAEHRLGESVVRMFHWGRAVATYDDAYYRINGVDIPLTGEGASAAASRIAAYGDAVDAYQLWQGIAAGQSGGLLYGVTLLHFANESDAVAWVTDSEAILAQNTYYGHIRSLGDVPEMGDQTTAFSYAAGGGADTPRAALLAVRVGSDVVRVHLIPEGRLQDVSLDLIAPIARLEVSCLQGEYCPMFIAVPDDFGIDIV